MTRQTRRTREPATTCPTTKKVYPTQVDATAELVAIATRPELLSRPKQEQRSYPCKQCGGFHLTSRPATLGKSRALPQDPQPTQEPPAPTPTTPRPGISQRLPQGPLAELRARLIQEDYQ